MKKLLSLPILLLFASFFACNNENDEVVICKDLITSRSIFATIDTTINYTGLIEVFPCIEGTTVYQGVYRNGELKPFPANYDVTNGNGQAITNPLTLTEGVYNLIYWGYPNYSNYNSPNAYVTPPGLTLGANLSTLYYSLAHAGPTSADTLYMPVYDMVIGTQAINFPTQDLTANLRRVTAGLNVIVSNSDSTAFSNSVDSMWMYVGGVNYQINFATGIPAQNNYKTVSQGLSPTTGRATFTSDSLYVFPTMPTPAFQLFVQLSTGGVKTFNTYIREQLSAGTFTTIYISLNGLLISKSSTGIFTIDTWREQTDSIAFPVI